MDKVTRAYALGSYISFDGNYLRFFVGSQRVLDYLCLSPGQGEEDKPFEDWMSRPSPTSCYTAAEVTATLTSYGAPLPEAKGFIETVVLSLGWPLGQIDY